MSPSIVEGELKELCVAEEEAFTVAGINPCQDAEKRLQCTHRLFPAR